MKPGDAKFVPADVDEEGDGPDSEDGADAGGVDDLLGNAFDAFQDGDREGFVRSMRAAMKE